MIDYVVRVQQAVNARGARVNALARRVRPLALLLDAWGAYNRDEMSLLAASLGYYILLAIFPLLLLLIAVASPFLASEVVERAAVRFISSYLPTLGGEMREVLRQVLTARGPVTLVAAAGLFWSSSGVFDVVQRGLNRAWRVTQPAPVWRARLASLITVLLFVLLFAASFAVSAVTRGGLRTSLNLRGAFEPMGLLFSATLNFLLFALIYKFLPHTRVAWRNVWGGALLAALAWESAKLLFVWYLENFARLSLIYGSVGAVIAVLIWGYITAAILLFGAELAAAQHAREQKLQIVRGTGARVER